MKALWIALTVLHSVAASPPKGSIIDVQGSINPGSSAYILENIKAAEQDGSRLLIIRLNTPGGLLNSTRDIIQGMSASRVPVVVYVSPGGASATSAGALIGLSAHVLAMAPGTNLGAAHPVGPGGEDVKGAMKDKVTNDTAALARAQATLRGRSPETAELIVTKSKSFSAEEAVAARAADLVASDLDELLTKIHGRGVSLGEPGKKAMIDAGGLSAASLERKEMRLQQKLLHFISDPNITALLMALGGLAIYAEVSAGFSAVIPGLIGVFCFLLAFISLQTLPVNVGGALLFALGFILLIAEVYITSYGLLTLAALASLLVGGLFLIDPTAGDMRVSLSILIPMIAGIGVVVLFIGFMLARDGLRAKRPLADPVMESLGKVETVDADGCSGTAYIGGELWRFRSGQKLKVGDVCKVTAVDKLIVQLERRT